MNVVSALHSGQNWLEVLPDWENDSLTQDAAEDQANHELMRTAAHTWQALHDLILEPHWYTVVDAETLCRPELDTHDMPVHALLAVAMTGEHQHALRALLVLRERVQASLTTAVQDRAAELMQEAA